jgi:hypothetical protein
MYFYSFFEVQAVAEFGTSGATAVWVPGAYRRAAQSELVGSNSVMNALVAGSGSEDKNRLLALAEGLIGGLEGRRVARAGGDRELR